MHLNLRAFKKVVTKATYKTTVQQKTVYQFLKTLNDFDSAALDLYSKTYNIYSNITTHAVKFQEYRRYEASHIEYVYSNELTYKCLRSQIDTLEAYCWNMSRVKRINWENFKHF